MRFACQLLVPFAVALTPVLAGADGFSARELTALDRGKLVARPIRNARSSLVGGSSWIIVDADWQVVWRALTDFPAYTKIFPRTDSSRLVEKNGAVRVVTLSQGTPLVRIDYSIRAKLNPRQREISFRVDTRRPHGLRDGWGFFNLEPQEGSRTLVSYGVAIDPGSGLLESFIRSQLRAQILSVPKRLKRWVEGPGRHRYAPLLARRRAVAASPTAPPVRRH